jgi:hypothetical protein
MTISYDPHDLGGSSPMTGADGGVRAGVAALAGFDGSYAAGLPVGTGQVLSFCRGLAHLDPTDLRDIYWSIRACLVWHDDLAAYDDAFAHYFLADAGPRPVVPSDVSPVVDPNQVRPGAPRDRQRASAGWRDRRAGGPKSSACAARTSPTATPTSCRHRPADGRAGGRDAEAEGTAHRAREEGRPAGPAARARTSARAAPTSRCRAAAAGKRSRSSSCWTSRVRCPPIRALLQFAYGRGPEPCQGLHFGARLTGSRNCPPGSRRGVVAAEAVVDWQGDGSASRCQYLRTWAAWGIPGRSWSSAPTGSSRVTRRARRRHGPALPAGPPRLGQPVEGGPRARDSRMRCVAAHRPTRVRP